MGVESMTRLVLHQMTTGTGIGDAITDHVFLLRRWLRELGFESEIYAEFVDPALASQVRHTATYRPKQDGEWVIYHHSTGSPVVARLMAWPVRVIIVYHNITPPDFFQGIDPKLAGEMVEGRRQLAQLLPQTGLALGVSPYNEEELKRVGFAPTGVLPLALDTSHYAGPSNPSVVGHFKAGGPLLLFVGRQVPNKKPEDLLKLLYFYRRIEPDARLVLVGGPWISAYDYWLREFARELGVQDAVTFAGHVTQQDMVTYYRIADLYVSMSEHEGFGKPLVESMVFDLPVLAYAAAGVPGTLGGAGVLFYHKHYEALAELADLLVKDASLREQVLEGQRRRLQAFLLPQVRQQFVNHLVLVQASVSGNEAIPSAPVEAGASSSRSDDMDRVHAVAHSRFTVELARLAVMARKVPDDDLFLKAAYRVYFNREPDPDGLSYYKPKLRDKSVSWKDILGGFVKSDEFKQVYGLPVHPLNALHQTRMLLIQKHLPKADVIVDLGGASEDDPRGALLLMGYPYKPKEIYIIDLPPDERMWRSKEQSDLYVTEDGIQVRFLYRSMADLSPIPDESVDMVFSGESIEHVTEEDGDAVCREAFRVLKPGGSFCLDTPNAALTRLESPDKFIHPEHKKEYYVHELRDKLVRWGFAVVDEKALTPMPQVVRTGLFKYSEMAYNIRLSDKPEEGYLFYMRGVKPIS